MAMAPKLNHTAHMGVSTLSSSSGATSVGELAAMGVECLALSASVMLVPLSLLYECPGIAQDALAAFFDLHIERDAIGADSPARGLERFPWPHGFLETRV